MDGERSLPEAGAGRLPGAALDEADVRPSGRAARDGDELARPFARAGASGEGAEGDRRLDDRGAVVVGDRPPPIAAVGGREGERPGLSDPDGQLRREISTDRATSLGRNVEPMVMTCRPVNAPLRSSVKKSHAGRPETRFVRRFLCSISRQPPRASPTLALMSPSLDAARAVPRAPVRSTVTGARFDPLLGFEDWKGFGTRLGTYANASAWWLGDWLAFGRDKYGRRYKEGVAATGLEYQTLRNYAVVARRFAPARRRPELTFQHHAEVTALPDAEQDAWLERAVAGRWSRNELRRRLRAAAGAPVAADEIFRVAVARRQGERWRRAAERCRCAPEAWIARVVDEAARMALAD
jgi:hypothetical protein